MEIEVEGEGFPCESFPELSRIGIHIDDVVMIISDQNRKNKSDLSYVVHYKRNRRNGLFGHSK